MMTLISRALALLALLISLAGCNASHARESHYAYVKDQYKYTPSQDAMADVDKALETARVNGELLLVVLGAQWCHDSKGLAGRFSTPEMQGVLQDKYETVFVDVGYLTDKRAITQRFGYPTYFATPTVMVINPQNEQLLNGDSMQQWAFADSISLSDYMSYFAAFTATDKPAVSAHSAEVKDFGYTQAQRLQRAYTILGPMLEKDENGETPEGFIDLWVETRKFRIAVQEDLIKLADTPADSELALPEYGPLSWEQR